VTLERDFDDELDHAIDETSGLKDTIRVNPARCRNRRPLTAYASLHVHCHILEHEIGT